MMLPLSLEIEPITGKLNLSEHLAILSVSGQDAQKFLQGQLTCDVNNLHPGEHTLAAHCNPQGRIISLFILANLVPDTTHSNEYYLILPRANLEITLLALKKYAAFFKVSLNDRSSELQVIGFLNSPPQTNAFHLPGNRQIVIQNPTFADSPNISFAQWKVAAFTAGIVDIYPETSGMFLPHDLNLQNLDALNFAKGCYTGQEIIARMHYKATLKKHLQAMVIKDSACSPGETIYVADASEKAVGTLVDCISFPNKTYLLALIDDIYAHNAHLFFKDQPNNFIEFLK